MKPKEKPRQAEKKTAAEDRMASRMCKTERSGKTGGWGSVMETNKLTPMSVSQMLGLLAKNGRNVRVALELDYKRWVDSAPRVSRHFADGLSDQELGKITVPGVVVYDRTRFKLTNSPSNFINASAVNTWDGARVGYLLTQIPSRQTRTDFWQMIVQAKSSTVAVLLPLISFNEWKVAPWWPLPGEAPVQYGRYTVELHGVSEGLEWTSYALRLYAGTGASRELLLQVQLLQMEAWTVDTEPPACLSRFLGHCRLWQAKGDDHNAVNKDGQGSKPKNAASQDPKDGASKEPGKSAKPAVYHHTPLVLVCPSGIQRCGLAAALALAMSRLYSSYLINLPLTIRNVRYQRYGTLSKLWETHWLYRRVAELALADYFIPDKNRRSIGTRYLDFLEQVELSDPAAYGGPQVTPAY